MGIQAVALRVMQMLTPSTPAAGSNAFYPKADDKWYSKSSAGTESLIGPIAKADIGLGSVDNTADTAKPVSTAQQTALNLKANLAAPALTGAATLDGLALVKTNDARLADARTPVAHTHDRIISVDTRAVATIPNDYSSITRWQFKQNSVIGIVGGGTYSFVQGFRSYTDSSGGMAHEYAYNDVGVWRRQGSTTTWGSWIQVEKSGQASIFADDARLTDARTPLTHTHVMANITDLAAALAAKAPLAAPSLTGAATLDGQAIVKTNDARLADSRTPLAHIHDDRYFTEAESDARFINLIETGTGSFKRARGVLKWEQSGTGIVGELIIQTNMTFGDFMTHLNIQGFSYFPGASILDLQLGFYSFTGVSFINSTAQNDGTMPIAMVRLMRRTSDSKIAIVITSGHASNLWYYPKIAIDAIVGHTTMTDAMLQGWSASISTDLTAYTAMTTAPLQTKANTVHGHALTDANMTGVLPIAQVPTGTTGTTVALGNHNHTLESLTNVDSAAPAAGDGFIFETGLWRHRALTKTDVGLSSVDNTADTAKPVSTAQQTALNLKANLASPAFTGTPTGITASHVGLGSVNNTADTAKPVSTAQQTALDLKANLASPAFTGTPTGLTKTHVGLSNVDNTADTAKPVSTAQQTALDLKANLASPAFTGTPTGLTKAHVGLSNVDNTADSAKPVSTLQAAADALKVSLAGAETITGEKLFNEPINLLERAATPATPASGRGEIYVKTDGLPYYLGDDGVERSLVPFADAVHAGSTFDVWGNGTDRGGSPASVDTPMGWSDVWSGATVAITADATLANKKAGAYSVKIYRPTSGAPMARLHSETVFDVLPGDIVTLSFWSKSDSATAFASVSMLTAPTGITPEYYVTGTISQDSTINLSTTYRKYEVSFIVPAGNVKARLSMAFATLSAININVWVDESASAVRHPAEGTIPSGAVTMAATATIPEGWLLCNGASYTVAAYPALAAALNYNYGGVAGTSFNVPDMRNRFPIGTDVRPLGSHETAAASGSAPGAGDENRLNHQHSHTVDSHDHGLAAGTTAVVPTGSGGGQRMTGAGVTGGRTAGTDSKGVAGTNAANHAMLSLNFIIKT